MADAKAGAGAAPLVGGPPATNRTAEIEQPPRRRAAVPVDDADIGVKIRDNFQSFLDVDTETLDPSFTYRWVRKDKLGVSRAKMKKYSMVDPDVEPGIRTSGGGVPDTDNEGHYAVGDVVLMKTPRRIHRARQKAKEKETDRRLGVAKRRFKKLARKANVEIFEKE